MISSTAQRRFKELLLLAKGDRVQAERLIFALIDKEPQFLRELVEPFLKGIIAHGLSLIAHNPSPLKDQKATIGKVGMEGLIDQLKENFSGSPAPAQHSERQAEMMKSLADAHAKKRRADIE